MDIGDEVEILISCYALRLYVGYTAHIVDLIVDKNDKPVLAVIKVDNHEIDDWNKDCPAAFYDNGLRNISLDHIRLAK